MLSVSLRAYQSAIVQTAKHFNTLVILPTGLGKTIIAFKLMDMFREGIFLTPTKPLAKQHFENFLRLTDNEAVILSGEIPQKKRAELYNSKFIFATPQTIRNDIRKEIFKPKRLIVFDECHRAVGDYAYVEIADKNRNSRILGLTASPGSSRDKIEEVINNLFIQRIEIRTEEDEDVKSYVMDKQVKWIYVSLTPNLKHLTLLLSNLFKEYANKLTSKGFRVSKSKTQLLELGNKIMSMKHDMKYTLMRYYSVLINLNHMIELLETQSPKTVLKYITKSMSMKKAGIKELLRNSIFHEFKNKLIEIVSNNELHPKMQKLLELCKQEVNKKKRGIIFVQYRDQIKEIVDFLNANNISAEMFVGKKEKYTRKQQEETLKRFRNGEFDFLVSSSIGEEGMDIPKVDVVIFYEPIPSEIRTIQRMGRTGRFREGEIFILITKNTRDEAFLWAAKHKARKMFSLIKSIQSDLESKYKKENKTTILDYF